MSPITAEQRAAWYATSRCQWCGDMLKEHDAEDGRCTVCPCDDFASVTVSPEDAARRIGRGASNVACALAEAQREVAAMSNDEAEAMVRRWWGIEVGQRIVEAIRRGPEPG